MIGLLVSLPLTALLAWAWIRRTIEAEAAERRMYESAKEAEDAGDLGLARRRYEMAGRMSDRMLGR